MKAMILAAGLGTRLKPWTLSHPKALVPVKGIPMLERVIVSLKGEGFDEIIVNIHHFGEQIIDFLRNKEFGIHIRISDERGALLDTGGGIVHARELLGDEDVLVHNVDILSNADPGKLMEIHKATKAGGTLLVSDRDSSRKLIFDRDMNLRGWHHLGEDRYKPSCYSHDSADREYAFSGIYVTTGRMREEMCSLFNDSAFPIMDYFLSENRKEVIKGILHEGLRLLDIGKPSTLEAGQSWW